MKNTWTTLSLLEQLSCTFGPSGCEGAVAELIRAYITPYCDEILPDRMGGVIARISGTGKESKEPIAPRRLMLSCHMDEVGFMVRSITDGGLLKISSMCGSDTRVLAGRRVWIGDEFRQVRGVFGVKPLHLVKSDDRGRAVAMDDMYVDIGASSRAEAEKSVHVGDFGTFESDYVVFGQDGRYIKGKALDDRLGCAVLCSVMRQVYLADARPGCDLYFAFTCREELGISGARTAAHKIDPDYAIVFEATAAGDIAGTKPYKQVARLGKGGAVSLMDRSTIYDRPFTDWILETAREREIPCQIKQYVSGGNDAGHIHKSRAGVRCAAISAPARYIHTASNVVAKSDIEAIEELALAVIDRLYSSDERVK